jgi:hypothetical protein
LQGSIIWVALLALAVLSGCGPGANEVVGEDQDVNQAQASTETVRALVARLDLERYKATIKGLTQFGDRLHGTDRNRAAVDWIEAELKSYGCATERFAYEYPPPDGPAPCGWVVRPTR